MYGEVLPYAHDFKRIMTIDEDIALPNTSFSNVLRLWDCSFSPTPLIAQLLIDNHRCYPYLSPSHWKGSKHRNVTVSAVGLVEQQLSLLDAMFFEWFTTAVISQVIDILLRMSPEAFHDIIWCKAALSYGVEVLGWNASAPLNPCVVLIGDKGDPYAYAANHTNFKTLPSKHLNRAKFISGMKVVETVFKRWFPSWVAKTRMASSPLYRDMYTKLRPGQTLC